MGGRNQLHLEYAYAIISILSSATMWACFRLIKRHGNTPRANSYMTLSQIAIGEGSGFFRFLVLRFFPPLVVLTGEAAILAKWKSSVNQQIICLSVSALLYVSLSYVPPLIRGFTFGERFLSLTLILAYPVLAFLIGAMTQCIDFSQFAPSNLQTMIDGIWQTFITAIIVITFYELLRNYPEEKYIEQDELYDRKSQIVIRNTKSELLFCKKLFSGKYALAHKSISCFLTLSRYNIQLSISCSCNKVAIFSHDFMPHPIKNLSSLFEIFIFLQKALNFFTLSKAKLSITKMQG